MLERMSRRQWVFVGGVVIVSVVLIAATAGRLSRPTTPSTTSPIATTIPTLAATPRPTPTATPESTPSPATPEPTPEPTPTDPPTADGDPRLLYAEFLLRVNDDRSTVQALNAALGAAAQAQDTTAVSAASVDILDFVDTERDWLRDHPPAECFAKAHKAARTMIAAYGDAAERFLDWSDTGGGLAGLEALSQAIDAATVAGDTLTAFSKALEATACPA